MKQSSMINELFVLRSIACLCVVMVHAIAIGLNSIPSSNITNLNYFLFDSLNMLLYFGTPVFIFISQFLISYSYKNKDLPDYFINKRIKLLFLPFLFMAFFYSIPYMSSLEGWSFKLFMNVIIGDYHGYFILIIFQFIILHKLFHRQLKVFNPKIVIPVSLFINITYLWIFNYTTAPNFQYAAYIWDRFYWVPFLGWIFYFTLGFYCGHYYKEFLALLKKYKKLILIAPIFSSIMLLALYHFDLLAIHSSKRIDILFHTTSLIFFLYYVATKLKQIPELLITISQYSFGIYLLHYFYQSVIDYLYQMNPVPLGSMYILLLFTLSITFSIGTVYYVNKWKYGQYIVGKIGIGYKENPLPKQSYKTHGSGNKRLTYSS
ncbi:acyltransferase family protein [Evansella sp. AB-P1]|uniref:acyltransferase family protein n=1 Tax=Evansella sp. AB-P1 TaxID=3037653 RepID=UPI00241D1D5E|nr:acyltransferase family protein [Evansella sp. AB-P1]MDG5789577.1 acyltransferase family protein [Evansella sp. AB-P1]